MKNKQKVGLIIKLSVAALVVLIFFFGSFYTVGEYEKAVVTTFGRPTSTMGAGIHVKIPFIQSVYKVDTTAKGIAIGYDLATNVTKEEESLMITSDYNFVNVDFYLIYYVADPTAYLYASNDPVTILKNIAQGCIRSVIGTTKVDDVLTDGKIRVQGEITTLILAELEKDNIGLALQSITIQDAEPPTDNVKEAFKAVENAKQGKETAINNANKYKSEKEPESEAKVDKIIKDADAAKEARINEAKGQVARFNAIYEEYSKFPLITKKRMFFEAMQEILPDMTIYIDTGEGSNVEKLMLIGSEMNY